ncbi:MAG: hypothetical protein ACI87E_005326, partial [Mariniblastus sp.]
MGIRNISRRLSGTVSYQKHFPENTQYITDFDSRWDIGLS